MTCLQGPVSFGKMQASPAGWLFMQLCKWCKTTEEVFCRAAILQVQRGRIVLIECVDFDVHKFELNGKTMNPVMPITVQRRDIGTFHRFAVLSVMQMMENNRRTVLPCNDVTSTTWTNCAG
ncbi:hypothetical protein M513_03656 [Trichuris suis]|uniref:Uncharacterized protein n=1 Tax=Trichuris suis TaxID=68888 RepID=A0A085MDM0_9BILA|nr:hypothetical protein M513_03656 [Trichuris suis]